MLPSIGHLSLAAVVAAILVAGSRGLLPENTTDIDFTAPMATYTTMSSLLVICPTTTQSGASTMSHTGSPVIESSLINHTHTISGTSASDAVCMTVTAEPPVTTVNTGTKATIFDGPLGNITIVVLTAYGIVVVLLLVIATLLVALGCTCKKHKSLRRFMNQQYALEHDEVPSKCAEDEEARYTSMENPMKEEPETEQTSQTEENHLYSPVEPEIELNIQTEAENRRYSRVEPEFELTIQTEENCCYGTGRVESHLYEVEVDEDDYVISGISVSCD